MAWKDFFTTQRRVTIALCLIVLLFIASTILHFTHPRSFLTFCVGTLTLIPLSSLARFAVSDLISRLRLDAHELVAELVTAFLGNASELCFVVAAVLKGHGTLARTVVVGLVVADCLLSFGACVLSGAPLHDETLRPIVGARSNARLLMASLINFSIPPLLNALSRGGEKGAVSLTRTISIMLFLLFLGRLFFVYRGHTALGFGGTPEPGVQTADLKDGSPTRTIDLGTAGPVRPGEQYQPKFKVVTNVPLCIFAIALLILDSVYITDSADSAMGRLGPAFLGLVVMPLALASMETILTIAFSKRETIPWILEGTTNSTILNLFFLDPLAVTFGWALDRDMAILLASDHAIVEILAITLTYCLLSNVCVDRQAGPFERLFATTLTSW